MSYKHASAAAVQLMFVLCVCAFQALLERTGYTLDVTTGQRKYGGPPPEDVFKGTHPGSGTEVEKWLTD